MGRLVPEGGHSQIVCMSCEHQEQLWGDQPSALVLGIERHTHAQADAAACSASSLLPMSGYFFVPGQRFRELYYWDTFWVVKGLLVSSMQESAKVGFDDTPSSTQNFTDLPLLQ